MNASIILGIALAAIIAIGVVYRIDSANDSRRVLYSLADYEEGVKKYMFEECNAIPKREPAPFMATDLVSMGHLNRNFDDLGYTWTGVPGNNASVVTTLTGPPTVYRAKLYEYVINQNPGANGELTFSVSASPTQLNFAGTNNLVAYGRITDDQNEWDGQKKCRL